MYALSTRIISSGECKVACTDKSYSEHVLCKYLTPSPTNRTLYLSRTNPTPDNHIEYDKSGSLPESSRTNLTPDNVFFHTII